MALGRKRRHTFYHLRNGEVLLYFMCGGILLLFLGHTSIGREETLVPSLGDLKIVYTISNSSTQNINPP